jgi:predicted GNAT family N-acyltransferase
MSAKSAKANFIDDISQLIATARATVARGVDLVQVHTNFEIGRRIVEEEQAGKDRAAYGQEIITTLAERLTEQFGRGFGRSSLEYMRKFYLSYPERISGFEISQSKIGKSEALNIS